MMYVILVYNIISDSNYHEWTLIIILFLLSNKSEELIPLLMFKNRKSQKTNNSRNKEVGVIFKKGLWDYMYMI